MGTNHPPLPVVSTRNAVAAVSCGQCHYAEPCGGLEDEQPTLWGCFAACQDNKHCGLYDWTCPCRPTEFGRRWNEVGGLKQRPVGELRACTEPSLPLYLPMVVTHGLRTVGIVSIETAAITTFELIRGRRGKAQVVASSPEELRRRCRLPLTSRILLVSVANDKVLAKWWSTRKRHNLPEQLAKLGVFGITVPNFSFFSDAPRPHTLWNRARMIRCAEEFSAAGLSVILHVNAQTKADWTYWADILREQPEHRYVAKEFQTGLLNPAKARQALQDIVRLQDRIGRELHPILIGAARLMDEVPRYFSAFTLIDSRPWMTTIKRQQAVSGDEKLTWRSHPTGQGESLDLLLEHNRTTYTEDIHHRVSRSSSGLMSGRGEVPTLDASSTTT